MAIGLSHSTATFSSLFVRFFLFFRFGSFWGLFAFALVLYVCLKQTQNNSKSVSKTTEGKAIFDQGKFINLPDILGVSLLDGR